MYRSLGYATHFESFAIAPYVEPALLQDFVPNTIPIVALECHALVALQARLDDALQAQLAAYEPAD